MAVGRAGERGPWRSDARRRARTRRRDARTTLLAASVLATCLAAAPASERPGGSFDPALYARLLERHTVPVSDTAGTRVDYAALRSSDEWRRLVASLDATEPSALASRAARLAFWIDVYNILAIDTVVQAYPVDSIRDVGSFFRPVWRRDAGRVNGRSVSLDEVEHEILRPMGEPRIHFAIVCASTSCPSLLREPFSGGDLEKKLEAALHGFLEDERKGMHVDEDGVTLSRIFDWFEEDFAPAGGVLAFVADHAAHDPDFSAATRAQLASARADGDFETFDYDWALNDVRTAASARKH